MSEHKDLVIDGLHGDRVGRLLGVRELSVASADGVLLQPVSFELQAGRALTLLGETGSGKSLLAHAVMGSLPSGLRASGRLAGHGWQCEADDMRVRRPLWGRELALLPQEPWFALDPLMRVDAQLAETYRLVAQESRRSAAHHAAQALRAVGLGHAARAWPTALSGGMAQRAAFAITRAGDAPILIVDEPTKGLDRIWRDDLVARLRAALEQGCAVLTITHDIGVARALGGDTMVMLDGRVVERGQTHAVLSAPSHDYTRALIAAEPAAWPRRAIPAPGGEVLHARALSKRFGNHVLFDGLDLTLHAGERVAVTGPSGSGKSTLGNVLLGLAKADRGSVRRAGGIAPVRYQKLYQDPAGAFAPHIPLGRALHDLIALHRLERAPLRPWMERLGLSADLLTRLPGAVSGGELQRFALLRALLLRPAFLFADEPTSRLDPVTQRNTIDLIVEAAQESDCALMLVTHDPDLAANVAARTLAF